MQSRNTLSAIPLLVLLALFMPTACATMDNSPAQIEQLTEQVNLVWEAKTRMQWGIVWDNTVQAYQQRLTRDQFVSKANVKVMDYTIDDVTIDANNATAIVKMAYTINVRGAALPAKFQEQWIRENGAWRLNLLPSLEASPFVPRKPKQ
ncbi:MAG: nuclear transport factor 2 family protein [Sulfitobacter sp.]|nr:nuclear transport factor 2 family protein [Sulfitobacter sp.]